MILTNDAHIAERLDKIAYPGLTANFDVSKTAALAVSLLDWKEYGQAYAQSMAQTARALAEQLAQIGLPVYAREKGFTTSHQVVIAAEKFNGGQTVSKLLRRANLLASGIGLPLPAVEGDLNGLRLGTPEIVRWGMEAESMPEVAKFFKRVLIDHEEAERVAKDVSIFRSEFQNLRYVRK
jgi:glycine hydroxymethyltransferase